MWSRGSGLPGQPLPRELSGGQSLAEAAVRVPRCGARLSGVSLGVPWRRSGASGPAVPCEPCCRPGGWLGVREWERPPVSARGSSGKSASSVSLAHCLILVRRLGLPSHAQLLLGRLASVSKEHSAHCECRVSKESYFCHRMAGFVSQGLVHVCLVRQGSPKA